MLCEICNSAPAVIAIKQAADGEVRELFVCKDCARRSNGDKPEDMLAELLFGAAFAVGTEQKESRCPVCGLSKRDFRRRIRLGCANCYSYFKRELAPILSDMHRGVQHVGKAPRNHSKLFEQRNLEEALRQAVAKQHFEKAAELRDRLLALEQQSAATPQAEESGDV